MSEATDAVAMRLNGLTTVRALVRTARPKQWIKNVLVFGAPLTGHAFEDASMLADAVLAFVAFCLVSSAVYFVNDTVDRHADARHPVKRARPIAAGVLAPQTAIVVAVLAGAVGLGIALAVRGELALVLAGYLALALAYDFALRDLVLLDLAAITGGFLLRAVAGGAAVDVPLSSWFLIVTSFGSLFLAAGKRRAEFLSLGDLRGEHRPTLGEYSEAYLRYLQYSASTVAIAAYCLWAFQGVGYELWAGLSIIPFVLGIFHYALLLESGRGGAPEDVVLNDVNLLVYAAAWVVLVGVGVYVSS